MAAAPSNSLQLCQPLPPLPHTDAAVPLGAPDLSFAANDASSAWAELRIVAGSGRRSSA